MKTKIAIIVAAFILLCITSVHLSSVYFSSGMSTQTAHVLTSLRALHEWGFFDLYGISVLIPHTAELAGVDIHRFTMDFNEGIYLSYPSGWLDLPYAAFVITHALVPSVEIGPAFLLIYNIIVDRLITAVLFALFLTLFLSHLCGKQLSAIQRGYLALIGCAFWLFSPPVLYWTQNAYGMDQAVIPFSMALLLFVAWKKCRISDCTILEGILLFLIVFSLCFIDWYGWVVGGMTIAACLTLELSHQRPPWRRMLAVYAIPLVAVLCVAGIFLFQLISFPDGFHQLVLKYGIRSAHSTETVGMTRKLFALWTDYWPMRHTAWIFAAAAVLYVFTIHKSAERALLSTLTIAFVLPPIVWTLLLPQHSAMHEFALLKFALPTITIFVTAGTSFILFVRGFYRIGDAMFEGLLLLGLILFSWITISWNTYAPLVPQDDNLGRQIADLMNVAVGNQDVPLADDDMIVGSRPPHKIWYANRWIYPPYMLREQIKKGFASAHALETLHPVYLHSEGSAVPQAVERLCKNLWQDTGIKVFDTSILICRNDELRVLYMSE